MSTNDVNTQSHILDYIRHLTTISTGSILLIFTIVTKVLEEPKYQIFVFSALVLFLINIVSNTLLYSAKVIEIQIALDNASLPRQFKRVEKFTLIISWLSFICAMVSFTVFAIVNI